MSKPERRPREHKRRKPSDRSQEWEREGRGLVKLTPNNLSTSHNKVLNMQNIYSIIYIYKDLYPYKDTNISIKIYLYKDIDI